MPYSSVPDSVRPGNWHYSLAFGRGAKSVSAQDIMANVIAV
ncbi:hypothetical protein MJI69_29005 [Salmonella enterica subsp. enterica serovar Anatum]|nr:hypothetical protein [Salmonella enterica subsp. enterica serovar Anatum]